MERRELHRPLVLTMHDDEGSWDLVCHQAGND